MAKKKRTTKKKRGSKKAAASRTASRGRGNTKFHGIIDVEAPPDGDPIADGERVLVVLRSVVFRDIPDLTRTNELALTVTAETDKESEGQISASLKVELLKYVRDHQPLNIRDLVIFSGKVHRHMTLRCSIDELDEDSIAQTKDLIKETLGLAKEFAGEGPTKTLLGGLPGLLGALLSFNKDDQVLVLNHSLYAKSVRVQEPERRLRAGRYTFKKRFSAAAAPQVEIVVELLAVTG